LARGHKAVNAIMVKNRDLAWVFGGKVLSHERVFRDIFKTVKWECNVFYLLYDSKAMRDAGYYKRMRGVGNAGATELLFLCWKGQLPKDLAKNRLFVDKGSPTYVDYMTRVPVALPHEMMTVPRDVKEATLAWGVSASVENFENEEQSDDDDADEQDAEDPSAQTRKYAKRNCNRALMRQVSNQDTIWFPLDNSPLLMRELVHETNPRWVIHGTPASGVGLMGILHHGCTVVAWCRDEAHATTLREHVKMRVAEEFMQHTSALCVTRLVCEI